MFVRSVFFFLFFFFFFLFIIVRFWSLFELPCLVPWSFEVERIYRQAVGSIAGS
jgi:hypothetical protein